MISLSRISLATAATLALSAGVAKADSLTMHVTNTAGTSLYGAIVETSAGQMTTGIDGDVTLNVTAGQQLTITRSTESGICADPGAQTYTVPDPVPASVSITLKQLIHPGPTAAIATGNDRFYVGEWNLWRQRHGLPRIQISSYLTADANAYTSVMPRNPYESDKTMNCSDNASDTWARIIDGGGDLSPDSYSDFVGLSTNPTPGQFFNGASVYIATAIDNPNANAIGFSNDGPASEVIIANCDGPTEASCGMTGDYGSLTSRHLIQIGNTGRNRWTTRATSGLGDGLA
jgi:hypothetical protein